LRIGQVWQISGNLKGRVMVNNAAMHMRKALQTDGLP
jgi:hypothetical protein